MGKNPGLAVAERAEFWILFNPYYLCDFKGVVSPLRASVSPFVTQRIGQDHTS